MNLSRFFDFVLVLARSATVIGVMPVFGTRHIPAQLKILAAASLAILMTASLPATGAIPAGFGLILLVMREVLIGLALGFTASFIFHAVEYAGDISGMQMGFAIAGIIDPASGQQTPLIGKFQGTMLTLLFLGVGGHYFVIKALMDSFVLLPISDAGINLAGSVELVRLAGKLFVVALQIAAPATILLLLVNVGMGVMARMVPQMNVFIVGFPLMAGVGVGMLLVAMPAFVGMARHLIDGMYRDMLAVLGAL